MTTPLNERRVANAIRVLAMDAVQKANSGHPGAPMGWLILLMLYGANF